MAAEPDAPVRSVPLGGEFSLRRLMVTVLAVVFGIYALICAAAYAFQERMVFYPWSRLDATPAGVGLAFEERWIDTEDGVRLHAWWLPGAADAPAVLFLHGNAGNISHRLDIARTLRGLGLSVLLVDYRGYGQSGGSPSEKGTYLDAQAAYDLLVSGLAVDPARIVIVGRSLGGGVATWLAARNACAGLVLEATFTSIVAMAERHYPLLPVRMLTRIRYDNAARMDALRCPLLVVHGRDDELVPFEHGQQLHALARAPKRFLALDGGHNDAFNRSHQRYRAGLAEFLDEVLPGRR